MDLERFDELDFEEKLKVLNANLLECAHVLEKTELAKSNIKDYMDKVIASTMLGNSDRIKFLESAWKLYIDYDDNLVPNALDNVYRAKKLINNLLKK